MRCTRRSCRRLSCSLIPSFARFFFVVVLSRLFFFFLSHCLNIFGLLSISRLCSHMHSQNTIHCHVCVCLCVFRLPFKKKGKRKKITSSLTVRSRKSCRMFRRAKHQPLAWHQYSQRTQPQQTGWFGLEIPSGSLVCLWSFFFCKITVAIVGLISSQRAAFFRHGIKICDVIRVRPHLIWPDA